MPKRSASSTTITVALGTSTPTSMTVVATSTCDLPVAEGGHRRLLLGRREAAVQQAEAQAREVVGLEALVGLLGRRHLELLALADQRAHDVGLAPGRHLARGPCAQTAASSSSPCAHSVTIALPAGRLLAEDRHVEVAVDGHGRGARDRRGRHHEHVGHRAAAGLVLAGRRAARRRSGAARRSRRRRGSGTPPRPGSARGCRRARRPRRPPAPASTRWRSLPVMRLVSSSTVSGRSPNSDAPSSGTVMPSSSGRMLAKCCSASTSVGAMNAPWCPPCTAVSSAATATTVLPAPTSPWSRRCIGIGPGQVGGDLGDHLRLVAGELERQPIEEPRHQRAGRCRARCPGWSPRSSACAARARAGCGAARRTPAGAAPPPPRPSTPGGGCPRKAAVRSTKSWLVEDPRRQRLDAAPRCGAATRATQPRKSFE